MAGEPIIEPDLPIVDAHHHLWVLPETTLAMMEAPGGPLSRADAETFRRNARYLLEEFLADVRTGHNVRATVFVEAHALSMYRESAPDSMKSVGEVEFANGVAAMSASGLFGDARVCAGIVGGVDLTRGESVEDVLVAQIRAGGDRYRGVRSTVLVAYDEDANILGPGVGVRHLLLDRKFRAGFKLLQPLGLSFDVWLLEPQLPDLIDLARAFPETQIVLDHVGTPLGIGRYAHRREERFPIWCDRIHTLSRCANVAVKLGGLGMPFGGFRCFGCRPPATSWQLAEEWRPYIETCIEAFGPDRCMFENNFPMDSATCSYSVPWNAFKQLAAGASKEEKTALFSGTAARVYRLDM